CLDNAHSRIIHRSPGAPAVSSPRAPQRSTAASWQQTARAKQCPSVRGGAERTIGGGKGRWAWFLELHADRMGLSVTKVLPRVFLRGDPTGVTGRQLDLDLPTTGGDPPSEGA